MKFSLIHKEQRVCLLLDVSNLYYSAKHLYQGRKVNFQELLKTAVSGRKLIRAFAYAIRSKTGEEEGFLKALSKLGIEIRIKDLQEFYGGAKKGDWDVGISIDAVRIAPSVDVVILASGDGDFIPLIEYLQNKGKKTEVISFGRSTSAELKEKVDEFFDLDKFHDKFLLKNK